MNTINTLKTKYQDLHNDLGIGYDAFLTEVLGLFYKEHDLPALYFEEDGFRRGDASIEELVQLLNELNEKYGTDDPAVFFEINENDGWEADGEEEYFTDMFEFLDSKFCEQLEEKLIEYKSDKRDEIVAILLELLENRGDSPNFSTYYYTLATLEQYIDEANIEYQNDIEELVSNFVDYDSSFSNYFK